MEFVQYYLMPYLVRIEEEFNRKLLREDEFGEYCFLFGLNGFLRGDAKTRPDYGAVPVEDRAGGGVRQIRPVGRHHVFQPQHRFYPCPHDERYAPIGDRRRGAALRVRSSEYDLG